MWFTFQFRPYQQCSHVQYLCYTAPLCGAVEETVAYFVTECMVLEGVREQFGVTREEVLEEILLFRGRTHEKVERRIILLEEMWRRRRREMDR